MNNVAVVILNWNGEKLLREFLPFVLKYSEDAQIIVADNNSTDQSVEFLSGHYPSLRIIKIKKNEGFSKGYNLALAEVNAEFYILLNSDVEVTANWIRPAINLMQNDLSIAAVQPKIKSYNQRDFFEYAGAAGGFIDLYGYPFCRGRIFDTLEKDEHQFNDTIEIFWATGACLFVRAQYFKEAGGLDEDFFAHMEEIDLCWRLKNMGYKIMATGESEVYHVGAGTLAKSNPRKTYLNFRNGILLLYKNLPRQKLYLIFIRMLLDGVAAVKFLLAGSPAHFCAVIKAHFYIYFRLKRFSKKRKKFSYKIVQNDHEEIYKGSIVQDYFLRNKKKFKDLKF